MKKLMVIFSVLAILGFSGWYLYSQYLPNMAAKAIVQGDYPRVMPSKLKTKLDIVRDTINHNVDEIIQTADTAGITVDQLLSGIDQVSKDEVLKTYQIIASNNITNPERAFDIAYENIKIEAFDPILLKQSFLDNVEERHIIRILNYVETNHLMDNLDMKMGKEIFKRILAQKRDQIMDRAGIIREPLKNTRD